MNGGDGARPVSRHPVSFLNRQGERLFGIVDEPAGESRDVAVLLLSPGVKSRVAPHRLYNKLADELAAAGCWVLRFDFAGLGDSEGTIAERQLVDLYASVALGRYREDTWDAMDWMRQTYGVDRFILGGLCGGAITGVLAAPPRADVAGILAFGLPVMVPGGKGDQYKYMTKGQLDHLRGGHFRKLLDPRSLRRLLTFQSDFRLIARAVLRRRRPAASAPPAPAAGAPPAEESNANPHFPRAFQQVLNQGRPALLLFSEMDRLWWEFEEKFLQSHRAMMERHGALVELGIVAGANHIFTLEAWQADVFARTRRWLEQHFPVSAGRTLTSSVA